MADLSLPYSREDHAKRYPILQRRKFFTGKDMDGDRIPPLDPGKRWRRVIDTSLDVGDDFRGEGDEVLLDPPECYIVNPRSTVVLIGK